MARINYHFEKRRKELAKKKKNEEKRERKLAKKNPQSEEGLVLATGEDKAVQPNPPGSLFKEDGTLDNVPRDPGSPAERIG